MITATQEPLEQNQQTYDDSNGNNLNMEEFTVNNYGTELDPNDDENTMNGTIEVFQQQHGYYSLLFDDRIISYYDANRDGCYRSKVYKFGLSPVCSYTEITDPIDRSCPTNSTTTSTTTNPPVVRRQQRHRYYRSKL